MEADHVRRAVRVEVRFEGDQVRRVQGLDEASDRGQVGLHARRIPDRAAVENFVFDAPHHQ